METAVTAVEWSKPVLTMPHMSPEKQSEFIRALRELYEAFQPQHRIV